MSPGFLLAALLAVIVTQVTRVVLGPRGPYVATLGLSVLGLIAGEILAGSGHLLRPSLGVLHPAADAMMIVLAQAAGSLLFTPQRD